MSGSLSRDWIRLTSTLASLSFRDRSESFTIWGNMLLALGLLFLFMTSSIMLKPMMRCSWLSWLPISMGTVYGSETPSSPANWNSTSIQPSYAIFVPFAAWRLKSSSPNSSRMSLTDSFGRLISFQLFDATQTWAPVSQRVLTFFPWTKQETMPFLPTNLVSLECCLGVRCDGNDVFNASLPVVGPFFLRSTSLMAWHRFFWLFECSLWQTFEQK